jgi:predicted DNA-binding transcriptional regulator YafY
VRRADRLFSIVQLLRGGRRVTARHLAERLEVSERTIYRDVDERHEIEALVVGVRFVEAWCGPGLAASARSALARIRGVVPAALVERVDHAHFELAHRAIDENRRLAIEYAGEDGVASTRTVQPLGLYFWGRVWTLAAWCELRTDFRSFRLDRIRNPRLGEPFAQETGKTLDDFLARMRETRSGPA